MSVTSSKESVEIREVWEENLVQEFEFIREIVDDFPFVAMDTEFPGIVCQTVGKFNTSNELNYATVKANVDMLNLIQLGLTFSDEHGNLPTGKNGVGCIWQFNFREFNVDTDVCARDSIQLLCESGIDFKKNRASGVDAVHFAELLMSSGVVLNQDVQWITFHSAYDFGYLLKAITGQSLPETQSEFFDLINIFFPILYDVKYLMKYSNSFHGGLNKLAEQLKVQRVGISHQAGSDSLLTLCIFSKLRESHFLESMERYAGVLYGLGVDSRHDTGTY